MRRGPLLDVIGIDGEIANELAIVLRSTAHTINRDEIGCQVATARPTLCVAEVTCDDPTQCVLTTLLGFMPVVTWILADRGIDLDCQAIEQPPLQSVDVGQHMSAIVMAASSGDNLLVRHGSGIAPAALAAEICRAFPSEQIVIITACRDDVLNVRAELRARRHDVVAITPNGEPVESGRIVVGTFSTMGLGCASIERRRLIVALNGRQLVSGAGLRVLTHAEMATLIGLVPLGESLAPRELDYLRGLVGFREVFLPTYATKALPISTRWIRLAVGPPVEPATREDVALRRYVWQNPIRNRQIKSAVDTLIATNADPHIGLLAESLEHALVLRNMLPGSSVIQSRQEFEPYRLPHAFFVPPVAIITGAVADYAPWGRFDGLVRADAGTGLPSRVLADATIDVCDDHRLPLVDFDDRFHPEFRRRSRQRREAYVAAGWFPEGVDAVAGRIDAFIAAKRRATR